MPNPPRSRDCPVCLEPESLCCCPQDPYRNLALKLVNEAKDTARATVTIKQSDLLVLCERAYKWAHDISKSVLSESRFAEPSEIEVQAGAVILATTPLIDAPKLGHNEWMGLSRSILEAAYAARR